MSVEYLLNKAVPLFEAFSLIGGILTICILAIAVSVTAQTKDDPDVCIQENPKTCILWPIKITVCPVPVFTEFAIGHKPVSLTLYRNKIAVLPYTEIRDIVALAPEVYQRQRGADIHMSGGRSESDMLYVIDGMRIMPN